MLQEGGQGLFWGTKPSEILPNRESSGTSAEFVIRLFSFPKTSSTMDRHCSAQTAALPALKWDLRVL